MKIAVSGKFALDGDRNPPRLKSIDSGSDGSRTVSLGRGVNLRLGPHPDVLDALLDSRIAVDPAAFTGLGSVTDGCAAFCTSNDCSQWALKNRRPRTVAKVVGVMADQPRYVLLAQPKLMGTVRARRESTANRTEGGLVYFVLIEPATVECPHCPGRNLGQVTVVSHAGV